MTYTLYGAPVSLYTGKALFATAGLEPILDLRTLRRVERKDHLEVWGPIDV